MANPETVGSSHPQPVYITPSRDDWGAVANCNGFDPDLFFPERGASSEEAKAVCRGCVVREPCLEYALQSGEKHGIWGGMSERQRRRLRRERFVAGRVQAEVVTEPIPEQTHEV